MTNVVVLSAHDKAFFSDTYFLLHNLIPGMKNEKELKKVILFFMLSCCWSPSFLFIKIAVTSISPIVIANLRVAIGGLILFTILKLRRINLPSFGPEWIHFSVMGFFSCALPFSLFSFGEQYIDSSFAAILNGTTPLFTLVIAHFFTDNDRMTTEKLLGSFVGFAGMFFLVAPVLFDKTTTILGVVEGLMAAASYGIGFVYAKKYIKGFRPLVVPTAQLLLASLFLLPFSLVSGYIDFGNISLIAILSVLGLGIFGSALAFVLYYKLIEITSATYVSAVNYVLPVFGAILGIVFLNEKLTWNLYLGSVMVIGGVMIINGILSKFKKVTQQKF